MIQIRDSLPVDRPGMRWGWPLRRGGARGRKSKHSACFAAAVAAVRRAVDKFAARPSGDGLAPNPPTSGLGQVLGKMTRICHRQQVLHHRMVAPRRIGLRGFAQRGNGAAISLFGLRRACGTLDAGAATGGRCERVYHVFGENAGQGGNRCGHGQGGQPSGKERLAG